jgi:hypothetical protein
MACVLAYVVVIYFTIMTIKEELYLNWKYISSVALQPNNKRFENVPCEWDSFDDFYKANYQRYYLAKKKWKNYTKIIPEKYNKNQNKGKYKVRIINFIRKVKEQGFTKENTVFTSYSDRMKYHKTSKKILINDKLLGTRDVCNILKKQGIKLTVQAINNRINNNTEIFKKENRLKKFKWKGKYLALHEIAKKENILHSLLQNKIFRNKYSLKKAVDYCKSYVPSTYLFEGEMLYPKQIIHILSKRTGINEKTLIGRFYHYNCDYTKITNNILYKKKIIAEKGDEKLIFDSISDASVKLKISPGNLSQYANGKKNGKLKGYKFTLV